jgi:DnaJ-class molecular chaperone
MFGKLARTVPCPMCHGTQKHLCNTCLGAGFVSAEAWERTIVKGALALLALREHGASELDRRVRIEQRQNSVKTESVES